MNSPSSYDAGVLSDRAIQQAFELAQQRYAAVGVDVRAAMNRVKTIAVSLHCWQGDDVGGFEDPGGQLGGGLAVTGNYPGKARTADELRADIQKALTLIPGRHRINLHAFYGETGNRKVDRSQLSVDPFHGWIDWARDLRIGMDFNPTFFAHRLASDGFTLAHRDQAIRQFWIDHGIACRRIGAAIGQALGSPCVTNVWVPDGFKDTPVDRKAPRERLADSLDAIFSEKLDPAFNLDAVESKLFGIGSESYVVGSHEFYLGYAATRHCLLCLDAGHFHPTESIADKISSTLMWTPALLLHVSRGVRWDSDHVVTFTDELTAIMQEVVRGDFLDRVHIGLDYFDASINRIAAWTIGTRNAIRAVLAALLEPTAHLRALENDGDYTARLGLLEEQKTMPLGAVWDYYCYENEVPVGTAWLDEIRRYEQVVLATR